MFICLYGLTLTSTCACDVSVAFAMFNAHLANVSVDTRTTMPQAQVVDNGIVRHCRQHDQILDAIFTRRLMLAEYFRHTGAESLQYALHNSFVPNSQTLALKASKRQVKALRRNTIGVE